MYLSSKKMCYGKRRHAKEIDFYVGDHVIRPQKKTMFQLPFNSEVFTMIKKRGYIVTAEAVQDKQVTWPANKFKTFIRLPFFQSKGQTRVTWDSDSEMHFPFSLFVKLGKGVPVDEQHDENEPHPMGEQHNDKKIHLVGKQCDDSKTHLVRQQHDDEEVHVVEQQHNDEETCLVESNSSNEAISYKGEDELISNDKRAF